MSGDDEIKLAENLKSLLNKRSLSLHQLSLKAKINKSSLHNYANGVVPQGLVTLIKISNFFGTSLDELILDKTVLKLTTNEEEEKYEITIKKL